MKRFILMLLFSCTVASAAGIKWEKDLSGAIERANKEKKPLMFVVTKNGCKWCDTLKEETLKNPKITAVINRDFIAYEGIMDDGTVPNSLMTPGTPATWFIKGKTPMFEPVMGAVDAESFLKALDIVKKEYVTNAPKK